MIVSYSFNFCLCDNFCCFGCCSNVVFTKNCLLWLGFHSSLLFTPACCLFQLDCYQFGFTPVLSKLRFVLIISFSLFHSYYLLFHCIYLFVDFAIFAYLLIDSLNFAHIFVSVCKQNRPKPVNNGKNNKHKFCAITNLLYSM